MLGYDASDWRKRTTWFESDLERREIIGDDAFERFLRACPMLYKKGKPVRTPVPPATEDEHAIQPVDHTSPVEAHERSVCESPEPVSPATSVHTSDGEEP